MRNTWNIFLLLAAVENSFADADLTNILLISVEYLNLLSGKNNNCTRNNYKHDPALSSKLNGYFYTLYTSVAFASNEIIRYDQIGNNMVFARTTTDGECCRTVNFTLGEEYNDYTIASDKDCSKKIFDDSAQQKLIVANVDETDGSCCIVMWICRKSRKGVKTLCDKRNVSQAQDVWIHKQYDMMGLKPLKIEQNVDYKGGKCFKN